MKYIQLFFIISFSLTALVYAEDYSATVKEKCKQWRAEQCRSTCEDGDRGKFIDCFIDPEYANKMTWRECYALHIGYSCPPCQDIFATNFGGSFKKESCEYFYTAIEKKNKNCGNCLQIIHHLQVELSDLN